MASIVFVITKFKLTIDSSTVKKPVKVFKKWVVRSWGPILMDIPQPEYHLNSKIFIYNFGVIKNNTRIVKKCVPVSDTIYFMVAFLPQWETESTRKI